MPRSSFILKLSAAATAIALLVIGGFGVLSVSAGPAAQVTIAVTLPPVVNTLLPGPTAVPATNVPPTAGSGGGATKVPPTAGSGGGATAVPPTAGSGVKATAASGNTAPTATKGTNTVSSTKLICIPMDLVDADATMDASMQGTMDASMSATMDATMDSSIALEHVYLGITVRQTAACGSQIVEVEDNSPASDAKLQLNDVIVAVDGNATPSTSDLYEAIESHNTGDVVTLLVTRNKALVAVKVTLVTNPDMGMAPSATMSASMDASMDATMDASVEGTMGATMEPTDNFETISM